MRFGDPGFVYGVALAQTVGHVVLRAADADLLPLRFQDFARVVNEYAEEVHELADDLREQTERQHRLLDEHAFRLAADPTEAEAAPPRESDVPFLNFAPLDNAVLRLKKSAKACDEALASALRSDTRLSDAQRASVDELLGKLEQTLLYAPGLPGREWYRHMIYAPGLETGYSAKTLPGAREAIEGRRWEEANRYLAVIGKVLEAYADRLDQVVAALKPARGA